MDFVAEFDAAGRCLRLSGDCRMVDAPALQRALDSLADAAPPSLEIDLSRAGEFAIGPSLARGIQVERLGAQP